MTIRKWAFAAAAVLVGAGAQAATVVTAAHLVDPVRGVLLDDAVVVIGDDGRVTALATGQAARAAVPAGARRVDLGQATIVPGLIDMHVHLDADATIGGYRGLSYTDNFWTVVGVANARRMLDAGFTTVRNVGSRDYNDVAIRQGVEGGYVPGPRIVPATFLIGALGGHCDDTEGLPPAMSELLPQINTGSGPDAMRQLVRKAHKNGAQVIKICATGGVLSKTDAPGAQQLTYDEMKAIAEEAHMLGLRVAAHAHGKAGIDDAIRAGIDTIEHASLADAESFRLAKAHGTWFDMDIYDDDYILGEGPKNGLFGESLEKERFIGRKQRETFRAAHAAGVRMLFGTDNGAVFPAGQNALQFAKMVEWGMTPAEAIRSATSDAAVALDRAGDVGQLTPGHFGDLVAVNGNPLADVRLLEHPAWVIKGGVVEKGPAG